MNKCFFCGKFYGTATYHRLARAGWVILWWYVKEEDCESTRRSHTHPVCQKCTRNRLAVVDGEERLHVELGKTVQSYCGGRS